MANVNPGPAVTSTASSVAVVTPVNAPTNSNPQGANAYRLLGSARGVSGSGTGDAATIFIINSAVWAPALIVTANGQVNGVPGSIATLALGVFTAAAAGGTGIKANAALTNNSAAGSAIALATSVVTPAQTAQTLFVNVGTALAGSTVDIFLYGYDLT
jgi:hypothetical protein